MKDQWVTQSLLSCLYLPSETVLAKVINDFLVAETNELLLVFNLTCKNLCC